MRFSIIIPVYNVEAYIRKCMETVMNQTFRDYEVIVVDDESPDNSMAIVEEFAQAYPGMIRMIHQKNTRQGGARNRGVGEARGEYLLFVDSDDYVSPCLLETVDWRLKETPCDILVFRYAQVTQGGKQIALETLSNWKPGVHRPEEDRSVVTMPSAPWNKAYRRAFYMESGVSFPEKLLYEDAVGRWLYAKARTISFCQDCLYYYVQSPNSSMRRKNSEKMLDILKVSDIILEGFRKDGLYQAFQTELEASLVDTVLFVLELINASEPDSPLQRPLVDYIRDHFPGYAENPQISPEMKKGLDCLLDYDFARYHSRFLKWKQFKEWLAGNPVISRLNQWRKRGRV